MCSMRILPILTLLLASCMSTPHSSEQAEVIDVVQAFFDVIESGDVERGAQIALPEATFVNVRQSDGKPSVGKFTTEQWLQSLSQKKNDYLEEFVGTPVVHIDGDLAAVWAEYTLKIDGELSHTGVDAINLVRTESGWKIAGAAYSVVK